MLEEWQEKSLIRIVDDDEGFSDAIRFILKTEGWLVVCYSDFETFLKKDDPEIPGCLILDYMMPSVSGIEGQQILRKQGSRLPILFLTAHADVDMAITAFRNGADDVLKKPVSSDVLLDAVEKAVEKYFQRQSLDREQQTITCRLQFELLSNRERQIVEMAVSDLMNFQIAMKLGLSERTVETHRANAYRKLGINDLKQLKQFMAQLEN